MNKKGTKYENEEKKNKEITPVKKPPISFSFSVLMVSVSTASRVAWSTST